MSSQIVEKYRKSIRVLHWVHTAAFVILFLTGLVLFIPGLSGIAQGSITRILHRLASIVFIAGPIIYTIMDPAAVGRGLKEAFTWGSEDMGWLKAAPAYYFLNKEEGMPPQGAMNTGQKMWWFITIVFGVLFVITGLIMWFATGAFVQWMILIHDISFIVSGCMLLLHIYLGVIHPLMTEAWGAITGGNITAEYAKKHHGKWYREISKGK
jgi:formate dehydrogenase subunit gamma